ncbi:MAG: hypothetical protein JKY62_00735 [Desulfocapsa sp.]|nr:hypothetical protein [Desulfocapsa sp.]
MKKIIAFANTAGGSLVIGRADNGKIILFEGKALLRVRVAHWPGPFYLKSEGGVSGGIHQHSIEALTKKACYSWKSG